MPSTYIFLEKVVLSLNTGVKLRLHVMNMSTHLSIGSGPLWNMHWGVNVIIEFHYLRRPHPLFGRWWSPRSHWWWLWILDWNMCYSLASSCLCSCHFQYIALWLWLSNFWHRDNRISRNAGYDCDIEAESDHVYVCKGTLYYIGRIPCAATLSAINNTSTRTSNSLPCCIVGQTHVADNGRLQSSELPCPNCGDGGNNNVTNGRWMSHIHLKNMHLTPACRTFWLDDTRMHVADNGPIYSHAYLE